MGRTTIANQTHLTTTTNNTKHQTDITKTTCYNKEKGAHMEDALFSLDLLTPTQPKDKTPADYKDLALVYLVTQKGGFAGNLWLLHIEDAKKFCSDDCSKGRGNFGGEWCFMWTALSHFFNDDEAAQQNKTTQGKLMPFVFIRDTGKQDKDFERLGIVKPSIKEVSETLEQAGYFISFTPDPH